MDLNRKFLELKGIIIDSKNKVKFLHPSGGV